ncbi:MAG: response regulator [Burkholderiaceae bacterium]
MQLNFSPQSTRHPGSPAGQPRGMSGQQLANQVNRPTSGRAEPNADFSDKYLEPLSLLLVDDDRLSRIMLASLLAANNLNVAQAENGLDALLQFQNRRFDVVLTDLRMPVMDGETLATRLREYEHANRLPHCRLVALAAVLEAPESTLLVDGLFDAALEKPALVGDVLNVIFED